MITFQIGYVVASAYLLMFILTILAGRLADSLVLRGILVATRCRTCFTLFGETIVGPILDL